MSLSPAISVIVPCYNEQEVLRQTHERLTVVLQKHWAADYEILYVNDGSRDATLAILREFAAADEQAKVLSFSRNFGHQAAIAAGLKKCKGTLAVIIDADLQDPPELIPEMADLLRKEKANVVYAVRKKREGESFFKKISAKAFYRLLNWLSDVNLNVDTGDYRLLDRKVIDAFNALPEKNKYIRGLISWMGYKQVPIYYNRDARAAGATKYSLRKMLKLASVGMFYFSKKPLKMALTFGFISVGIGLLLSIWILYLLSVSPDRVLPGWASLIITFIFFGGVQLITIGVTGEYIGNILDEVKGRPEFILEEELNIRD